VARASLRIPAVGHQCSLNFGGDYHASHCWRGRVQDCQASSQILRRGLGGGTFRRNNAPALIRHWISGSLRGGFSCEFRCCPHSLETPLAPAEDPKEHISIVLAAGCRYLRGYLQVDAAPAYDDVFAQNPEIVEVGCLAHARRYLKEALPTPAVRWAQALAVIGQLCGIERAARDEHLDAP
jgi:hypothetical protein